MGKMIKVNDVSMQEVLSIWKEHHVKNKSPW